MMTLREFLKKQIPSKVTIKIREAREARRLKIVDTLIDAWLEKRANFSRSGETVLPPRRVIIIPGDQTNLFGSLGEDAMITATASMIREANLAAEITILVSNEEADFIAKRRGFRTASVWDEVDGKFVDDVVRLFRQINPDAVFVVGADLIDGHYGEIWGAKLLIASDIAARMDIPVSILGFSFNNTPSDQIVTILNKMDSQVGLNVRDEISFERIRRFSTANGSSVADSAFLLRPENSPSVNATISWAADRRREGCRVIAFNIHPMLIHGASGQEIERLVLKSVEALSEVSQVRKVAWLLLPHDFREAIGDEVCLRPIMNRLSSHRGVEVRYFEEKHTASVLKAVSGIPDGIVTGRMHLAIAGFGQGVPAAGLTYQEKFEGLFRHFELDDDWLLSPSALLKGASLRELLIKFYDNIPALREKIQRRLPPVMALSKENFRILSSY